MGDYGFTDAELMALFNTHDRNQDNMLNYEEFVSFWGVNIWEQQPSFETTTCDYD